MNITKVKERLYYLRNFMRENNQLHKGWLKSIDDAIIAIKQLGEKVETLEAKIGRLEKEIDRLHLKQYTSKPIHGMKPGELALISAGDGVGKSIS